MEHTEEITRHAELLYWGTIEEAWNKRYHVKKYMHFKFKTQFEILLWDTQQMKDKSIPFYVFLNELQGALVLADKIANSKMAFGVSTPKKKLSFMLYLSSLSIVADAVLDEILTVMNTKGISGVDNINTIIKIGKSFGDVFSKSLSCSDPSYFIREVFGATEQVLSSDAYKRASQSFDEAYAILEKLESDGFFELFYQFSDVLKKSFLPHAEASTDENQVVLFEDGLAWCNENLENSFFYLTFGTGTSKSKDLAFIEAARAYFRLPEQKISGLRKMFFGRIFQEFVFNKAPIKSELMRFSSKILEDSKDDDIYDFFASSYNSFIIKKYEQQIISMVQREIAEFDLNASFSDINTSSAIHSVVFTNVINKLSSFFSSNRGGAMLAVKTKEARDYFTAELSALIRDAYIKSILPRETE